MSATNSAFLEPLGPAIDFHYRFTRFCLSTYLIRNLRLGGDRLTPSQRDALNKSVIDASDFCRFFMELGPATRDAARYMGDFGFVMISFSCLFIIQACETFRSAIDGILEHLATVEESAQLMKELAITSSHIPGIQGRNILAKLNQVCETLPSSSHDFVRIEDWGAAVQHFPFSTGQGETFMIDPMWDLLDFFPEYQPLE